MKTTQRRPVTRSDVTLRRRPWGVVVEVTCNGDQIAELRRRDDIGSHAPHNWGVPLLTGETVWFHHRDQALAYVLSRFELVEEVPA